jgi:hypothetical protein
MKPSARTAEQLDARALARRHREAMRRRARRIRRSVAGFALALFAAAFLVVYVQLASGNDPALVANGAKREAAALSAASDTESSAASETPGGGEQASGESSSSGSEASSSGASAVTTSQS